MPFSFVPFVYRRCALVVLFTACLGRAAAAPTNIFSTQFEFSQGYRTNLDLVGQNSWTKYGSGGNGVLTNFIAGQGQQAYLGFDPPVAGDKTLFLLRPINFSPIAAGLPLVKFTTLMRIEDSENGEYDFFQWSVYNLTGDRLFTLDFDNSTPYVTNINYALDGGNYVSTGARFFLGSNYTLTVTMNFASNRWSATLNSILLATNLPMTTTGKPLTLGDVDAVWDLFDINAPGDNFMLFDNYSLTAEALATAQPPRPRLTLLGFTGSGQASLRLTGQSGSKFTIEASTNLIHWTALKTNFVSDGTFDYVDSGAPAFPRRLYRARWVP